MGETVYTEYKPPRVSDILMDNAEDENICWTYTNSKCKNIGIKSLMGNKIENYIFEILNYKT